MSRLIVTAIMDLSSRGFKRHNVLIYPMLIRYMLDIGYKIVCFIEPHIVEHMPSHHNLTLIIREFDALVTHDLIAKNGHSMYIGSNLSPNFWVYPVTNNAKPFLVHEAMELFPDYELYLWMDAGLYHADPYNPMETKNALDSLPLDKITICISDFPDVHYNVPSMLEFWKYNRFNVAGGLMSFPKIIMNDFMHTYREVLSIAKEHNLLLYEEQILPVVMSKDWSKYHYRFTEYKCITNLVHMRTDFTKAINNISVINTSDAMNDLLNHIIRSIEAGTFKVDEQQFTNFLYNAHIKSYYCNRPLSDRLARIIKLIIRDGPIFLHAISKMASLLQSHSNIEANIAYNNVTIADTWQEHFKQYPDDIKMLAYYM